MENDQKTDQLKITIAFGLMSFYLGLLVYLSKFTEIKGALLITISELSKGIFLLSLILFYLFILLTGAFYKSQDAGTFQGYKINPNMRDSLYDYALGLSFYGVTIGLSQFIISYLSNIALIKRFIDSNMQCGIIGGIILLCIVIPISILLGIYVPKIIGKIIQS